MMNRLTTMAVAGTLMLGIAGIPAFAAESKRVEKPAESKKSAAQTQADKVPAGKGTGPIDLNFATREQLMTLPGITAAYADKIVAGRPYREKSLLSRRKILPLPVFYDIVDKVAIDLDKAIMMEKAKAEKAGKKK